jgi:hypothetical protein
MTVSGHGRGRGGGPCLGPARKILPMCLSSRRNPRLAKPLAQALIGKLNEDLGS